MGNEVIELSIDETNALRLKLGLKPLKVTSEEDKQDPTVIGAASIRSHDNDDHSSASSDDQEEDGNRKSIFQNGVSLADDSADGDALTWARKMKIAKPPSVLDPGIDTVSGQKRPKNAENNQIHDETDLMGLKVVANVDDIGSEQVILTLKDESILDVNENFKVSGVTKSDDQLENLDITEKYKIRGNMKRKRDLARYKSGYADWEDDDEADNPTGFQIGGEETKINKDERERKVMSSLETVAKFTSDYEEEEPLDIFQSKKESKKHKKKKDKKKKRNNSKSKNSLETIDKTRSACVATDDLNRSEIKIKRRKRRVREGSSDEDEGGVAIVKRANYKRASKLAEKRTKKAFEEKLNESTTLFLTRNEEESLNDEEINNDDGFLNLAIEKARRLKRLKNLSQSTREEKIVAEVTGGLSDKILPGNKDNIVFEAESALDFVKSLKTKSDDRESSSRTKKGVQFTTKKVKKAYVGIGTDLNCVQEEDHASNLAELSKEIIIKDENDKEEMTLDEGLSKPIGRGLASVLGILKSTGEVGGQKGGKEEMRGRAKDERTYEDYDTLDLEKIVKVDASDTRRPVKDLEYANKEIKLEYRDEFGRLLTRKEAFRQMSYQFHGHGSGKRNEERRLKAIAREQASSEREKSECTTIGALKKTQEATGKAYVVHKS